MSQQLSNDQIVKFTATQTSKAIKKHLQEKFGHAFSVRLRGSSLDIRWTDGASYADVSSTVAIFERAEMIQNGGDSIKGTKDYVEWEGIKIDFGIEFICCQRKLSLESTKIIAKYISDMYGYPFPAFNEYGAMRGTSYEFDERFEKLSRKTNVADLPGLVWAPVETTMTEA